MNKQEFLEQLRRSISVINDYTFINDTIAYYEDYIESEIRKGSTEEEVLAGLGDPRLIAKSILATRGEDGEMTMEDADTEEQSYGKTFYHNGKAVHMPTWLFRLLIIAVAIIFLLLAFTVLYWLLPFIVIGVLVYLFVKFIKNNFG